MNIKVPEELVNLPQLAAKTKKETKAFFKKIKKRTPKDLDATVHKLDSEAFARIDCLTCANCCKTLGPRITDKDISKLAKHLRMKPSAFVESYLKIDEDNDYVFQSMPCPFLADDNYCLVYDNRPKACREYPHTNQKKFKLLLNETALNTATCPAVFEIVEKLKKHYS